MFHKEIAQTKARAAGEQQRLADSLPHAFCAKEDRLDYEREQDVARGMWRSQRRSAYLATKKFLAENK